MSRFIEVSRKVTFSLLFKHSPSPSPSISAINATISSSALLPHPIPSPHTHAGAIFPTLQNPNIRLYSSSTSSQSSESKHSIHMNRLFPRSNTGFKLSSGIALQSDVVRLTDVTFLVDSGIGTPRTCLQDELIGVNKNRNKIRFENRVGFLDIIAGETRIKQQLLERFFIDLVTGDSSAKERATVKFNDMVGGSADVDAVANGEPLLVLPRRYRQQRSLMELNRIWRTNSQVKGFFVGKMRGGYAVAIGGFCAFIHYKTLMRPRRLFNDRFTIESFNPKTRNIVVI